MGKELMVVELLDQVDVLAARVADMHNALADGWMWMAKDRCERPWIYVEETVLQRSAEQGAGQTGVVVVDLDTGNTGVEHSATQFVLRRPGEAAAASAEPASGPLSAFKGIPSQNERRAHACFVAALEESIKVINLRSELNTAIERIDTKSTPP
ncbi:hypothetical protein FVE85_2822 [Porphyridium purpureum]|uniref:Uncharacterized protein n=1 Tax=Porphyridium purpureum TaxID=35688 RepID=A0A5J4YSW1_PORPP|nr:hypothetical protein FVE85_2822 [Porphyridium purpureum]|eukprot:POR9594..scf227_4